MRHLLLLVLALSITIPTACGGGEEGGPDASSDESAEIREPAGGPGETGQEPRDSGPSSGAAVFAANCATCHGDAGRGDGPAATGLEPPPADLTDGTWTTGDGSLQAVTNTIEHGSPGTAMIGWKGTLTDSEIAAVAQHVLDLGR